VYTAWDIEFELKQADGSYQNQFMCGWTSSLILYVKNTNTLGTETVPITLWFSGSMTWTSFGSSHNTLGTLWCSPVQWSLTSACSPVLDPAPVEDLLYCVADLDTNSIRSWLEPESSGEYWWMEFFEIEFGWCGCVDSENEDQEEIVEVQATVNGVTVSYSFTLTKPFCDCNPWLELIWGDFFDPSDPFTRWSICEYENTGTAESITWTIYMEDPFTWTCRCAPFEQCGDDNDVVGEECADTVCFDATDTCLRS